MSGGREREGGGGGESETHKQHTHTHPSPLSSPAPGFSLTFSLGNCSLGLATGASVSCVGPYTRFRMTPAVLTGPYVRPGFFVGEQCAAAAAFGGVQRTVLAVLDKNAKLIPSQIAAQVSGAVSGVVAALPQPSVPGVPLAGFLGGVGSSSATAATDGGGMGAAGASAGGGAGGGGGASTTAADGAGRR